MKVYLCGPIDGCTDEECRDWRYAAKCRLPNTLDPMRRDYRGKEERSYREIVELDKIDVIKSDAILVNYEKPSVGTSMEILYAWENGKLVILVHRAGAFLSPWLIYHSHHRVTSLDDAFTLIETLA